MCVFLTICCWDVRMSSKKIGEFRSHTNPYKSTHIVKNKEFYRFLLFLELKKVEKFWKNTKSHINTYNHDFLHCGLFTLKNPDKDGSGEYGSLCLLSNYCISTTLTVSIFDVDKHYFSKQQYYVRVCLPTSV